MAVIGLIDRDGCRDCVDEGLPLKDCCFAYVDVSGACVTCDAYRLREEGEG